MKKAFAVVVAAFCILHSAFAVRAANGDTRLIDAIKAGNSAAVQALLKQRALVNVAEADGSTALHWAARMDRLDLVQALLKKSAQANVKNRYGITPLTLAAVNGSAPVIDALLRAGADPNATDTDGQTILMLSARTGKPDAVKLLLDHSLLLYGSGMGNGNVHSADMLPTLLVGSAAGTVKGGRHIVAGTLTRRMFTIHWIFASASA